MPCGPAPGLRDPPEAKVETDQHGVRLGEVGLELESPAEGSLGPVRVPQGCARGAQHDRGDGRRRRELERPLAPAQRLVPPAQERELRR